MTQATQDPFAGTQALMTPFTVQFPVPPVIPAGEEIYNKIMGEIEPELTTMILPTLKQKYANETPEQNAAREARYQKAFAEYEKRRAVFMNKLHDDVGHYERNSRQLIEMADWSDDQQKLQSLSSIMDAS